MWTLVEREFPDYPVAKLPAMLDGFEDQSWHNDVCPSMASETLKLRIWCDYEDTEERELNTARYCVHKTDDDGQSTAELLSTDDWNAVVGLINTIKAGL